MEQAIRIFTTTSNANQSRVRRDYAQNKTIVVW